MPLRSGELATMGGVGLQTLRFYEREGLLPTPPRAQSNYRVYPDSAVRRVRFIKRAQELGFSLAEVRELLSLRVDRHRDRADVRALAHQKLRQIDEKLSTLASMRSALLHLTDQCTGHGSTDECPILSAIDDGHAPDPAHRDPMPATP